MRSKAFTLIEILVGTALFLVVAFAVFGVYTKLLQLANANQARVLGIELADEQMEIVRNMPFTNVGLTDGIPLGVLPQTQTLVRGGFTFTVTLVIRNLDLATSTLQASSKLVEVDVACASCQSNFTPIALTGQVSPANLQTAGNGGALVVQVFDANSQPVQGATVTVQSLSTSTVTDTDVTNNNGVLQIIGVPPGYLTYRITVTKPGYSTARTYPQGTPSPLVLDSTIVQGQPTTISLSIDRLSTLNVSSVNAVCSPQGSLHFNLTGAKQIATGVPKYSQSLVTNGGGALTLPSMEWDTYSVTPTDLTYDVEGINPPSPFVLNPGNIQNLQLVVVPHTTQDSLMVSVIDSTTKLPVSNAIVQLTGPGNYNKTLVTGQGYLSQSDWSDGPTQNGLYTDIHAYANNNGLVDTTNTGTSSGSIVLHWFNGATPYQTNTAGTLESSSFDTGTTSNFYALNWTPISQPILAGSMPVKFQFATAPTSAGPWSYLGPDGTSNTYFTVPGGSISSSQNNNEFARYMAYLTTSTATVTPQVSSVSFSYTSGCIPPGQVLFQGLSPSSNGYAISVGRSGHATTTVSSIGVTNSWQQQTVSF